MPSVPGSEAGAPAPPSGGRADGALSANWPRRSPDRLAKAPVHASGFAPPREGAQGSRADREQTAGTARSWLTVTPSKACRFLVCQELPSSEVSTATEPSARSPGSGPVWRARRS